MKFVLCVCSFLIAASCTTGKKPLCQKDLENYCFNVDTGKDSFDCLATKVELGADISEGCIEYLKEAGHIK